MIYKDFQVLKLSALGFGAMRLPVIDHNNAMRRYPKKIYLLFTIFFALITGLVVDSFI